MIKGLQKFRKLIFLFYLIVPASLLEGQECKLTDLRHSFRGTNMRLVFDFDSPFKYEIMEDWLRKKIVISFLNSAFDENFNSKSIRFNNIVLKGINFDKRSNNNLDAVITVNNEFLTNVVKLNDPYRLAVDVKLVLHELSADEYFRRGLEYENGGEYEKALQEYRKAISIKPGHPESYFHAGIIRMLIGEPQKALINFRRVPENSLLGEEAVKYIFQILESNKSENENNEPTKRDDENKEDFPVDSENVEDVAEKSDLNPSDDEEKTNNSETEKNSLNISNIENLMLDKDERIKAIEEKINFFNTGVNLEEKDIENDAKILFFQWWYFYIAGGVLALITGFFLAKKLFNRHKKRKDTQSKHLEKVFKRSVENDIKLGRIPKYYPAHGEDKFREKLVDTYSKTNKKTDIKKRIRHEKKDLLEEEILHRNNRIDKILTLKELTPNLKNKYKLSDNCFTIKDKYIAVYKLSDLGWDEEKIAKELHMEVEEVRLSLNMRPENQKEINKKINFREINRLLNQNKGISEIARKLNVSVGEIELAVSMKGSKKVPFTGVYK